MTSSPIPQALQSLLLGLGTVKTTQKIVLREHLLLPIKAEAAMQTSLTGDLLLAPSSAA